MSEVISHDEVLQNLLKALKEDKNDKLTALAIADRLSELGDDEASEKYRTRPDRVVSVGPDDLDDDTFYSKPYEQVFYSYIVGIYEGEGTAICKRRDGLYDLCDLSHNSCYGPLSDWDKPPYHEGMTVEQLIKQAGDPESCMDGELWKILLAMGIKP